MCYYKVNIKSAVVQNSQDKKNKFAMSAFHVYIYEHAWVLASLQALHCCSPEAI